jgi:hypothetical protein
MECSVGIISIKNGNKFQAEGGSAINAAAASVTVSAAACVGVRTWRRRSGHEGRQARQALGRQERQQLSNTGKKRTKIFNRVRAKREKSAVKAKNDRGREHARVRDFEKRN